MSVTHIVSDFSREVALHLELLEVFGEIDWAGIKLLHLVYIMMPVRVIVSSQDQVQRALPPRAMPICQLPPV